MWLGQALFPQFSHILFFFFFVDITPSILEYVQKLQVPLHLVCKGTGGRGAGLFLTCVSENLSSSIFGMGRERKCSPSICQGPFSWARCHSCRGDFSVCKICCCQFCVRTMRFPSSQENNDPDPNAINTRPEKTQHRHAPHRADGASDWG